ncbi:MAG TPA: TIGR03435 family protein [Terriglobia bacterium]|jgi:uncharacterized protein (TIGR03435 family)
MYRLRGIVLVALILAVPALLPAQGPGKLAFEVATIKAAAPLNPATIAAGQMPHLGMNVQGTRVDIGFMSISDLIVAAYKTKANQITGPDWLKTERFDILAKMPDGTTKDDVPVMLQALLADRFGLKIHKDMREDSVYALVVAKGGPKLKESAPDPEVAPDKAANNNPQGAPQIKVDRAGGGATVTTPRGAVKMSMTPDGHMRLEMNKMSMADFAQQLTPLVDHPVFDMTELKGNFQVALDLSMDTMLAVVRAQGMNLPIPAGGRGALPGAAGAAEASEPSGASSIFSSVQQLGLRLEARKMPLEYIMVDHLEKTPTEN